jgi:nucleoside-diphosphate-sugar epimerase
VGTLIEVAAAARVSRVVQCSTVGVHGNVEHAPANEDAPLRPGDVYQRTKLLGEQIARETARQTGVQLTIVRPSGIFGPGDTRLLKLFRGVARRRFVMVGSGRISFHMTYVDDVVEGLRLAGEAEGAAGRTYIIAGGSVSTLKEVVATIAKEAGVRAPWLRIPVWPLWPVAVLTEAVAATLGIEPPLDRRRMHFFTHSRAFDISRARTELGYDPQVSLVDGIRRSLEWYRAYGWL